MASPSLLSEEDANDLLYDMESNLLFVAEEDGAQRAAALVRAWPHLPQPLRARLVEAVLWSASSLAHSATGLLEETDTAGAEAIGQHASGLNAAGRLMHGLCKLGAEEAAASKAQQAGAATGKAKPARGKKGTAARGAEWEWEQCLAALMEGAATILHIDLVQLMRGLPATEGLVNQCTEMALWALESAEAMKREGVERHAATALGLAATRYGQLEFVARELLARARKAEHMPLTVAKVAQRVEAEHKHGSALAARMLAEFISLGPQDYDEEAKNNSTAVKHVAEVVAHLGELLPRTVSQHLALLQPYLACTTWTVRACLVSVMGNLMLGVYGPGAAQAGGGASQAHLRSKDHLLRLLRERTLDKSAFVRQRVLKTWALLVEASAVPLPWLVEVMGLAMQRLEDESRLVVKAATGLVYQLVHSNPWGTCLEAAKLEGSLHVYEAKLRALLPPDLWEAELGLEADEEGEEEESDAGAVEGQEGGQEGDAEAMDADCDGGGGGGGSGSVAGAAGAAPSEENTAADLPYKASVAEVRFVVASLKTGVAFARRLAATVQRLRALLAYPAADVVQEAIVVLTFCRKFEVFGAEGALRAMWPLIFSREEGVRTAVVDAWFNLYLAGRGPQAQARELVQLLDGCTLGELESLGAIVAALAVTPLPRQLTGGGGDAPIGGEMLPVRAVLVHLLKYLAGSWEVVKAARRRPAAAAAADRASGAVDGEGGASAAAAQPSQGTQVPEAYLGGGEAPGVERQAQGGGCQEGELQQAMTAARHIFSLLAMLAAVRPEEVAAHARILADVGLSQHLQDAWVARHACIALTDMAPLLRGGGAGSAPAGASQEHAQQMQLLYVRLVRLLVAAPGAGLGATWGSQWYSAAQAALEALYALHPHPYVLAGHALQHLASDALPGTAGGADDLRASSVALSRFFFLLGHTAAQQLLLVERLAKAVRAKRLAADRAALEARERALAAAAAAAPAPARRARGGDATEAAAAEGEDGIAAELGAGSAAAADAELDEVVARAEAELGSTQQLVGRYGQVLAAFCWPPLHTQLYPAEPAEQEALAPLQQAALLALAKLMAACSDFCVANAPVLFTLLIQRRVAASVRTNLVVSLADLFTRHPNAMEPWTPCLYGPLQDPDGGVQRTTLKVLTHLMLSDMVKAKGHVAKVARLLVHADEGLARVAHVFFDQLSRKTAGGAKGTNPVYGLLPDILSHLCREEDLGEEGFKGIMLVLLQYVKQDKRAEGLHEKLAQRMGSTPSAREWRSLAFVLSQVGWSEKGLRCVMDLTKSYKHALGEDEVYAVFMAMADKGRKAPDKKGDLRERIAEWEQELAAGRQQAQEQADMEAQEAERQAARNGADGGAAAAASDAPPAGGAGEAEGVDTGGGAAATSPDAASAPVTPEAVPAGSEPGTGVSPDRGAPGAGATLPPGSAADAAAAMDLAGGTPGTQQLLLLLDSQQAEAALQAAPGSVSRWRDGGDARRLLTRRGAAPRGAARGGQRGGRGRGNDGGVGADDSADDSADELADELAGVRIKEEAGADGADVPLGPGAGRSGEGRRARRGGQAAAAAAPAARAVKAARRPPHAGEGNTDGSDGAGSSGDENAAPPANAAPPGRGVQPGVGETCGGVAQATSPRDESASKLQRRRRRPAGRAAAILDSDDD